MNRPTGSGYSSGSLMTAGSSSSDSASPSSSSVGEVETVLGTRPGSGALPERAIDDYPEAALLSAQGKNATIVTPILCPPPRLWAETLVAAHFLATALLFRQIATLFASRIEVAALADAILSGR
jgi:hypothetical protein